MNIQQYFWEKIKTAREYYELAKAFEKEKKCILAGINYLKSIVRYPLVGYYYWPNEVKRIRFSMPYRILKVYFTSMGCLLKGLFMGVLSTCRNLYSRSQEWCEERLSTLQEWCEEKLTLCRKWLKKRLSVKTIDLEKTYESCFFDDNIEDILFLKEYPYEPRLLKDSIYVKFLQRFKGKSPVDETELKETEYYQAALEHMTTYGDFRSNKDETKLLAQSKYFLNLYQAMQDSTFHRDYLKYSSVRMNHSAEKYPLVFKILHSEEYLVFDGHHRLACQYVLGKRFVKARIVGIKKDKRQALDMGMPGTGSLIYSDAPASGGDVGTIQKRSPVICHGESSPGLRKTNVH